MSIIDLASSPLQQARILNYIDLPVQFRSWNMEIQSVVRGRGTNQDKKILATVQS